MESFHYQRSASFYHSQIRVVRWRTFAWSVSYCWSSCTANCFIIRGLWRDIYGRDGCFNRYHGFWVWGLPVQRQRVSWHPWPRKWVETLREREVVNDDLGWQDALARNMQSAAFNLQYARSIPSLSSSLTAITTATSAGQLTAAQQNSVRGLLTSNDQYDFASAVWFLTSQCPLSIRSELQTGSLAGWQGYVGSCIGTAATSDRQAYWQRACGALGVDNHWEGLPIMLGVCHELLRWFMVSITVLQ